MTATLLIAAAVGGEAAGEPVPMAGMAAAGYGAAAATLPRQTPLPVRVVAAAVLACGVVILLAQL